MRGPWIDQRHVVAAGRQVRADIAADRTGADEGDAFVHAVVLPRIAGVFAASGIPPGRPQPHRGVVEHRAAPRRARIVAGQRIDADAAFERLARPDALRDQHTRLQSFGQPRMQHHLAARIAEPHPHRRRPCQAAPHPPACISTVGRPSRFARTRHLGEAGVEETARRCGHQPERTVGRRLIDARHMIRQASACSGRGPALPSRARNETACRAAGIRSRKCACSNGSAASIQRSRSTVVGVRPAGRAQRRVDDLHRGHFETRDASPQAARPVLAAPHGSSGIRRAVRSVAADLDVRVAACLVQVVVLHEHRCGQHDIGPAGSFGHELLVHGDEQVVARKAAPYAVAVGADGERVLVLDQQRVYLRAVAQFRRGRRSARCRSAHVEHADRRVDRVQALDQRLVPVVACRDRTTARRRPRTARRRSPWAGSSPHACWPRRCARGRSHRAIRT